MKHRKQKEAAAMDDLIDEDPPADSDDPAVDAQRGTIPSYPIPKPPLMGAVPPNESTLQMGEIDPKVVSSNIILNPLDVASQLLAERDALLARVAAIEALLGFVATEADLNVRVAALERFVGIKP
jgi:hypothetical protein